MMELCQLYDEQGLVIPNKGATKDEIFFKGLLHAAAHVWIWRLRNGKIEVLLQKRSDKKLTWPGLYDISAAGHVDLGEDALAAAVRETAEEIGVRVEPQQLKFMAIYRSHTVTPNNLTENEYQIIYLLEIPTETNFSIEDKEVSAVEWKELTKLREEVLDPKQNSYVPHGDVYYQMVLEFIENEARL